MYIGGLKQIKFSVFSLYFGVFSHHLLSVGCMYTLYYT